MVPTSLVRNESYMKALNRRVERVLTGVAERAWQDLSAGNRHDFTHR